MVCVVLGVGGVGGIMWKSPGVFGVEVMRLQACDVLGMLCMLCMTSPEGGLGMHTVWHPCVCSHHKGWVGAQGDPCVGCCG